MLTKFISTLTLLVLLFSITGCGQGTTTVGNSSENISVPTITIGKLVDGTSTVEMSLGVFGADASALSGASFDIRINGNLRSSNLDPADFFVSSMQNIQFRISPLKNGDELEFIIHKNTGGEVIYTGTVSSDADTLADSNATDLGISTADNPFGIVAPANLQPNLLVTATTTGLIEISIDSDVIGDSINDINNATIEIKSGVYDDFSYDVLSTQAGDVYDSSNHMVTVRINQNDLDCTPSSYAIACKYLILTIVHADGTKNFQYIFIEEVELYEFTAVHAPFPEIQPSGDMMSDVGFRNYALRPMLDTLNIGSDCDDFFEHADDFSIIDWDSSDTPESIANDLQNYESRYVEVSVYPESEVAEIYTEGLSPGGVNLEAVVPFDPVTNTASTFMYAEANSTNEIVSHSFVLDVVSETEFNMSVQYKVQKDGYSCTLDYNLIP